MREADVAVIGAGVVGMATAYEVTQRWPGQQVVVLEKEDLPGRHQTGHNSGVIHSGIYYQPGSLKAVNCRAGRQALLAFCQAEGIPHEICGKVIVAVDARELPVLERIYQRGRANGVACEWIGPQRLAELEPCAAGVQAIHVPEAGIVDFTRVCGRLAEIVQQRGGVVCCGAQVSALHVGRDEVVLGTARGEVRARWVVNCAGLHSDRVVQLGGQRPPARIIPFRGEYYRLRPETQRLCRNLIYPVPDPDFPFLGVHFTRMIDGSVECGPNAVLALAREGYRKTDVNLVDLWQSLTYPGFLRLARRYWRVGAGEMWRSWSKAAFVRALERLVPAVTAHDLLPAPAGVRAQAVAPDGRMVDDFLIIEGGRVVHVCNAPSPAATSSLNVARLIADRLHRLGAPS